jgi:ribonucleotide reductase alpha subunit
MWTKKLVDDIIRANGSVQSLDIPEDLKRQFRTVWEVSMRTIIDLAADRAPFVDQTQSMNLFVAAPTVSKLTEHSLRLGAGPEDGVLLLRSKPRVEAVKFTLMEDSVSSRFEECESCSA